VLPEALRAQPRKISPAGSQNADSTKTVDNFTELLKAITELQILVQRVNTDAEHQSETRNPT
jgi:hypothetical protein